MTRILLATKTVAVDNVDDGVAVAQEKKDI